MKAIKIITQISMACALTLCAYTASATSDGFYLGMMLGEGNTHNTPKTLSFTTTEADPTPNLPYALPYTRYTQGSVAPANTGLAGRFFVGVNINSYVGTEFGFTHYPNSSYNANKLTACYVHTTDASSPCEALNQNPNIQSKEAEISENAVDLAVKGMYPLGPFGLFVKGGISYVRETAAGSLTTPSPSGKNNSVNNFVGPELGLGAYYDLTPNWEADFSINRVFHGTTPADLYAIGIAYHFVTLYCGQFIC